MGKRVIATCVLVLVLVAGSTGLAAIHTFTGYSEPYLDGQNGWTASECFVWGHNYLFGPEELYIRNYGWARHTLSGETMDSGCRARAVFYVSSAANAYCVLTLKNTNDETYCSVWLNVEGRRYYAYNDQGGWTAIGDSSLQWTVGHRLDVQIQLDFSEKKRYRVICYDLDDATKNMISAWYHMPNADTTTESTAGGANSYIQVSGHETYCDNVGISYPENEFDFESSTCSTGSLNDQNEWIDANGSWSVASTALLNGSQAAYRNNAASGSYADHSIFFDSGCNGSIARTMTYLVTPSGSGEDAYATSGLLLHTNVAGDPYAEVRLDPSITGYQDFVAKNSAGTGWTTALNDTSHRWVYNHKLDLQIVTDYDKNQWQLWVNDLTDPTRGFTSAWQSFSNISGTPSGSFREVTVQGHRAYHDDVILRQPKYFFDFESPDYSLVSVIAQDGWSASSSNCTVSNTGGLYGSQSLYINDSGGAASRPINGATFYEGIRAQMVTKLVAGGSADSRLGLFNTSGGYYAFLWATADGNYYSLNSAGDNWVLLNDANHQWTYNHRLVAQIALDFSAKQWQLILNDLDDPAKSFASNWVSFTNPNATTMDNADGNIYIDGHRAYVDNVGFTTPEVTFDFEPPAYSVGDLSGQDAWGDISGDPSVEQTNLQLGTTSEYWKTFAVNTSSNWSSGYRSIDRQTLSTGTRARMLTYLVSGGLADSELLLYNTSGGVYAAVWVNEDGNDYYALNSAGNGWTLLNDANHKWSYNHKLDVQMELDFDNKQWRLILNDLTNTGKSFTSSWVSFTNPNNTSLINAAGKIQVAGKRSYIDNVGLLFGSTSAFPAGESTVATIQMSNNGSPSASIVIGSDASNAVKLAACELQYHLQLITGGTFPIVSDETPVVGTRILVGGSKATDALWVHSSDFSSQEYLVGFLPGTIVLMGEDVTALGGAITFDYDDETTWWPDLYSKRGALNAVYEFLEHFCGVNWYMPLQNGIAYTSHSSGVWSIDGHNICRTPDMKYKLLQTLPIPDDLHGDTKFSAPPSTISDRDARLWEFRNRMGGEKYWCDHSLEGYSDRFNDAVYNTWFYENIDGTQPRDGNGLRVSKQLCFTNTNLASQVAADANAYFENGTIPTLGCAFGDYFAVAPLDGTNGTGTYPNLCQCAACRAIWKPGGVATKQSVSNYIWQFVDAVADQVIITHPDKFISALAYSDYNLPPTNVTLGPNVTIQMCLHVNDIADATVVQVTDDTLSGWATAYPTNRKFVWNYFCYPTGFDAQKQWRGFPPFFAHTMVDRMADFYGAGVRGIFMQPAFVSSYGESFQSPLIDMVHRCVALKLADDSSLNGDTLISNLFTNYFGADIGAHMEHIYNQMETSFVTKSCYPDDCANGTMFPELRSERMAWGWLGRKSEMADLGSDMAHVMNNQSGGHYYGASALVKSRLDLFDEGIWRMMLSGRHDYFIQDFESPTYVTGNLHGQNNSGWSNATLDFLVNGWDSASGTVTSNASANISPGGSNVAYGSGSYPISCVDIQNNCAAITTTYLVDSNSQGGVIIYNTDGNAYAGVLLSYNMGANNYHKLNAAADAWDAITPSGKNWVAGHRLTLKIILDYTNKLWRLDVIDNDNSAYSFTGANAIGPYPFSQANGTVATTTSNGAGKCGIIGINAYHDETGLVVDPAVTINSGVTYCNSTSATLALYPIIAGGGLSQMQFSNDGSSWSGWETFNTTKAWTLASGEGIKIVYAQFKDLSGNTLSSNYYSTIILDATPPSCSVSINAGAAYCSSTSVTLTCSATDGSSGVYQMRCSNDNLSWSSWETYTTTKAWTLTTGDGTKTVYVQYKDNAGNVTTANITDTIVLDATLPIAGTSTPPASVTTTTISVPYSGASDATSGLNKIELWYKKETGGTWTNSGLTLATASGTFVFTPSSGSGRYYFDLVAQDNAGNRSAAAIGSGDGVTIFKLWWSDGFESNNFTTGGWTNSGCTTQSTYKYSGTYAAQFNSTDSLTKSYSTSGKTSIIVEYARYIRTCDAGDHFIADWSTNGSTWTTLEDRTGVTSEAWTVKTWSLPTGANNQSGFRIRFRVTGYSASQYAYLDDVKIIGL